MSLVALQTFFHASALLCNLTIITGLTDYPRNLYVTGLILMLLQGSIAYVRILFYRRE